MSAWCGDTITHGDSCIGTYLPVLLFLVALHHLLSAGRIFYKFLELQSTLLAVSAGWAVFAAKFGSKITQGQKKIIVKP